MKSSEPARFASTYFAPSTCLRVSRPFVNNSLSTMACLFCSGHGLAQLNRFRLSRASHHVRKVPQRRSFGHASYSPGLAQFLDIFEPAKWRAFDPGKAQSGVGLLDNIASATSF